MEKERSKYWDTMVEIVDNQFPKGTAKERGSALVMLAYIEMMLTGTDFKDGEPVQKEVSANEAEQELI